MSMHIYYEERKKHRCTWFLLTDKQTETNSYKMEITEVDNWYEYYKKTYSDYHGIENAAKNHFKK